VFTGIVTGVGRVISLKRRRGGTRIRIRPPVGYGKLSRGESVCISGVCLTAVEAGREFAADLSAETVRRTTLGELAPGAKVNLEKALRWGGRLSGHFVMGHVDGISRLLAVTDRKGSWSYRFSIPAGLARYVVSKGSVALEGISLTVAARRPRDFDVAIIPETRRNTTLGLWKPGDALNFEADIFARYGKEGALRLVRRQLSKRT